MDAFFAALGRRLADPSRRARNAAQKPLDQCTCGQPIFFGNSHCLNCQSALGYLPAYGKVATLAPTELPYRWRLDADPQSPHYRRCANLDSPAMCNWLVPADSEHHFCLACRLSRTIPDLSVPGNALRWSKLEAAKRRMVSQLLALGLPVVPRTEDSEAGLAFDFLGTDYSGHQPVTGHASGLITLNIEEADDARREQVRTELNEPYRTLLGHFRHEVGHYYWDRLVADSAWLEPFRECFGDERADYGQSLEQHYQQGPPSDWPSRYISAYATMHPWEDWAETWAHYLHMMDTLDTALTFGMRAGVGVLHFEPFTRESLHMTDDSDGQQFLDFVNAWIELAAMLNELSRSMGQSDIYPFVLSAAVVAKLHFVHRVVGATTP
ncbi:zinc-binding metallopeptidase family protein [Stutzerimonas tarimensis]|uniref:Zinc-binding metallopeptidase n=1 Tax=Stutzerimonas tarimensis TaxID=1507735 RepID=A0ABV7T8R6_9GAMM